MLDNIELVTIAIGNGNEFKMEALSNVLGINIDTLRKHVKFLENNELIYENKENSYFLTSKGSISYDNLLSKISEYELVPELHFTSMICKLESLLPSISNPISLVKILISIDIKQELDIIGLLRIDSALKPDSQDVLLFEELSHSDDGLKLSTDIQFKDLTMLGRKPEEKLDENVPVREILITADQKRRNGEVWEALQMFINLLHSRKGLLPGEWITCLIGWITCIKIIEGPEKAIEMIDVYLSRINKPEQKGLLYYLKADILSDMGINEKASEMYFKSLKIMRRYKMKISESELLNSYGVHFFRMDQFDHAEKQWMRGRSISRKNDVPRMKAIIEVNLSDIYSKGGRIRTAHDLLRKAESFFKSINDQEGICDVFFNRSLVLVREGRVEKAHDSFRVAREFPMIYQNKKDEMLSCFNRCLIENGYPPVRKNI